MTDPEVLIVNRTARSTGAVGGKAITPRYVAETSNRTDNILDYGAGKNPIHADALRQRGLKVTAYDIGENQIKGVHNPAALKSQYDTVYASNVLNVAPSESFLRKTLSELQQTVRDGGRVVFNYPESPRKSDLSTAKMQEIVSEYFPNVKRVGGTSAAPLWQAIENKPSPIYHGSPAEFTEFDLSKQRIQNEISGKGISFTDNPETAKQYALGDDSDVRMGRLEPTRENGFIYKVTLSKPLFDLTVEDQDIIRKVYDGAKKSLYAEEIPDWEKNKPATIQDLYDNLLNHFGDSTNEVLEEQGFSGLKESSNEIRVFNPKYIKTQERIEISTKENGNGMPKFKANYKAQPITRHSTLPRHSRSRITQRMPPLR